MYILNENIRRYRKERGMTQRELAERLGTTDKTVSRWESGVQIPDAETVPALAHIFEVSIGELYGEERVRSDDTADTAIVTEVVSIFPSADKRMIRRGWIGTVISALLVLCGSLALCLNNLYSTSVPTVGIGYLPFYGNQTGRTLGIVLFGAGCLCMTAVLTAYTLRYRKPSRYNPRYADTAASLNLFMIILFCALLLFILPRFFGFAVTPAYVIALYVAAFVANILLTVHKRGFTRRHSVKTSAVITMVITTISWVLGGLSLAALLICLDLHVFDLMAVPLFSDGGVTAANVAFQLYYESLLDSWFSGAYYYFLLTTSVPLSAMLLLNSIEWKVRADRLNKENPTEYADLPKKKRIAFRVLSIAVALVLLAGSVYAVLSVSGVLLCYETVEVLTDSMSPTLQSGDTVSFCTSADMENLWQGDVILFETTDGLRMIGRITRTNNNEGEEYRATSYVVQQDNPDMHDKRLVYPQDVIGVWLDAPMPESLDEYDYGY